MNIYSQEATASLFSQKFAFIQVQAEDHVLTVTLDRAEKKNALHPQMVHELAYAMQYAHYQPDIWMVVFEAKGNVFCAGADLKAMSGQLEGHNSSIPDPDKPVLIGELFNKIHKPTLAKVTGDVYAGGFFFLAGATIVLAQDNIKLALPEVKRGLFPFQVMAALLRVMPQRKVLDWCIRGYSLPVQEAAQWGLVSRVVSASEIDSTLQDLLGELKENSPTAMRLGLQAYDNIHTAEAKHDYMWSMLQQAIMSEDGREGLRAFREKRNPLWKGK